MKKLWASIFLLSTLAFATSLHADELSDLQAKIADAQAKQQALQNEEKKLQAQIDAAQAKGTTLNSTIKVLQATKAKIDASLRATQNSITADNLVIQKLTLTISKKQSEVDTHTAAIAKSLRELQGYDRDSLVTRVLTDGNLSNAWQDEVNLNSLEVNLQKEIAALKADQADLNKQKEQKVETKNVLTGLQKQLSGQKQSVQSTQIAQTALLAQTRSQEAAYQELLTQKRAEEKQFDDLLFQYQSQLKVSFSSTSYPTPTHSSLGFPLDNIRITQQFGRTADSVRLYTSGTHNGTDFGTPAGTPVKALRNGTVAAQGNTDSQKGCYSYGRWMLIQYDDGLSSIYGHLSSSIATTGDSVAAGQVVGYSGGVPGAFGSGYSTGPHLHVGLYVTQAVKVEQYSASINCKLVSIPIAPPDGYLDPLAYMPAL